MVKALLLSLSLSLSLTGAAMRLNVVALPIGASGDSTPSQDKPPVVELHQLARGGLVDSESVQL
jgi:hypothetical protein